MYAPIVLQLYSINFLSTASRFGGWLLKPRSKYIFFSLFNFTIGLLIARIVNRFDLTKFKLILCLISYLFTTISTLKIVEGRNLFFLSYNGKIEQNYRWPRLKSALTTTEYSSQTTARLNHPISKQFFLSIHRQIKEKKAQ